MRDQLEANWPHHLKPGCQEVKNQLAALIGRGFIRRLPKENLKELPRYIKAASLRLTRLPNAWQADGERALQIELLAKEWRTALHQNGPHEALDEFRWMLEELKVSLFAQELKTPYPVSVKRLQKRWDEIKPLFSQTPRLKK